MSPIDAELIKELAADENTIVAHAEQIRALYGHLDDEAQRQTNLETQLYERLDLLSKQIERFEAELDEQLVPRLNALGAKLEAHLSMKPETPPWEAEPGADYRETLDEHEQTLGDLVRRIQALERVPEAPPQALASPGKRLVELEAQARQLGTNWAEVEIYERPDGRLVFNNFLWSKPELEATIAKRLSPPKADPLC